MVVVISIKEGQAAARRAAQARHARSRDSDADLTGVRIVDSRLDEVSSARVFAPRSMLHNVRIEQFPDLIIARMFSYTEQPLLQFSKVNAATSQQHALDDSESF